MNDTVTIAVEASVATITLNRPHLGNALDLEAFHALMKAAIRVDEDESIRCVILTGNGKLFCAGGDVRSFNEAGERLPSLLKEVTTYLNSALSRLARMDKPLIVAVNGAAAGAGFGLALCGDIILAADTALFTTAYGAIGLSPDGGVSYWLPRLVGLRAAQELLISSRKVGAQEACDMGLATRVVPSSGLLDEAKSVATDLVRQGTRGIGVTRSLLLSAFSADLEHQLELEARTIARTSSNIEARAAINRFMARGN